MHSLHRAGGGEGQANSSSLQSGAGHLRSFGLGVLSNQNVLKVFKRRGSQKVAQVAFSPGVEKCVQGREGRVLCQQINLIGVKEVLGKKLFKERLMGIFY